MLDRIQIVEEVSGSRIRLQTKVNTVTSWLGGGTEVRYFVKVPAGAELDVETVNGGIEITGTRGRVTAETTNGGVTARRIGGPIDASTTNGGVDVDVEAVTEPGIDLECTNGGISLRLPRDAKATLAASITNGGIDANNLQIEVVGKATRRRLEGRLNGGGPRIALDGTNGGIRISASGLTGILYGTLRRREARAERAGRGAPDRAGSRGGAPVGAPVDDRRMEACPACGSPRIYPSRARSIVERIRRGFTRKRPVPVPRLRLASLD